MSFYELFKKGHQTRNKAHFASIASIAMTDGKISEDEQNLLQTLAIKLGVNKSDVATILKNPAQYPIVPSNSADERLERMHDLFDMIFSDQKIDAKELVLIKKYAIGLGYNSSSANELIQDSIEIYTGKISYNEYKYLIKNRLKK
ncbi:MAG: TerB family tellurite resistance protein [Flavobacteriaceae bacterium]|nr:TerB family tellurite resistance protein [Flavobacteriaceae bacterium]MDG1790396.1 TerB family tellurite resistance protein [Flavobacteriaceae bacterium]MDG2446343.1 TerB family tellurite resistance protein [Flavobacteriaceae bacterium]